MMKNNATKIEEIFESVWWMHFGHYDLYPGDGAYCEECMNYMEGVCSGGRVPEECMMEKAKAEIEMLGDTSR